MARASRADEPRCSLAASATWAPIVRTGLSALAGSCSATPTTPPRSFPMTRSVADSTSTPSSASRSAELAAFAGSRRTSASALRRLAAAGFADECERVAGVERKRHAVDDDSLSVERVGESNPQVPHVDDRAHGSILSRRVRGRR